ncbi:hypothetical protein TCA2_2159 [Paenibacillus sp. TCA20]|nr:hypothetical protein TCA2_2159 [Paenibacillus sp. TCA20]
MWMYPIDGNSLAEVLSMSNYANRMEYRSLHMNMLTNALFCHEYKPGERCSLGFLYFM